MQETSKPVAAALLSIVLICSGFAAPAAQAHSSHRKHVSGQTGKHASRVKARSRSQREGRRTRRSAVKPAKPLTATKPTKDATPNTHKEGAEHKREHSAGEAPSTQNATAGNEARIAQVLATPCQSTELIPTSGNLPVVEAATLCLINRERAEHGVAPLVLNEDLEAAAQNHCAELIEDDYFAHVAPDGETPVQRIERTGYIPSPEDGYVIGENLAWGTYQLATPQSIVAAWIASPGHLANILESRYTETGIAITPVVPESVGEGNPGSTYAEEFGVIVS